jgi:hypothetical protein
LRVILEKQETRMRTNKTMKRLTVTAVAAVLFAPAAALAHGAGGHGGAAHGHFSHHTMSSNTNSNGLHAIDRDKGHARAADRMSQNGLKHNNAGITAGDNRTGSH